MAVERRITREVRVGNVTIGGEHPVVVQSMTATKTRDVEATSALVNELQAGGAGIVRIAVDTPKHADALEQIRANTDANLSVDLQESYRLITRVAPHVDKVRYNPGHLWHHEKGKSLEEKVAFLAETAEKHDIALRVGVNCGSVDPEIVEKFPADDKHGPMIESALQHTDILDRLGFRRYVVSLKDSDPKGVVAVNQRFSDLRPDIPLHLGVTESGLPKYGINKSKYALGILLSEGIGETLRVSLTVSNDKKVQEVTVGNELIEEVRSGEFDPSNYDKWPNLDLVGCPSCDRVESKRFVELTEEFDKMTEDLQEHKVKVAFMGCRVNGPGEGYDADLGAWCAPTVVFVRKKEQMLGSFSYEEILPRMREELEKIIAERENQ